MGDVRQSVLDADALVEEHGLTGATELLGIDLREVLRISEQRALRAVVGASRGFGYVDELRAGRPVGVTLDAKEREMLLAARSSHLDGWIVGWLAARATYSTGA